MSEGPAHDVMGPGCIGCLELYKELSDKAPVKVGNYLVNNNTKVTSRLLGAKGVAIRVTSHGRKP